MANLSLPAILWSLYTAEYYYFAMSQVTQFWGLEGCSQITGTVHRSTVLGRAVHQSVRCRCVP